MRFYSKASTLPVLLIKVVKTMTHAMISALSLSVLVEQEKLAYLDYVIKYAIMNASKNGG
jgi:hypothetical protein